MSTKTLSWTALAAAFLAFTALCGCSQAGGTAAKAPSGARSAAPGAASKPADGAAQRGPVATGGPAIEVTWEALARERYLMESSRFKRRGPQPPQKITLLSESHPDAGRARAPRTQAERERFVNTAVLPDADMRSLVQGLQRSGFYRHARPTALDSPALANNNARGRVTVSYGEDSRTLISMRGQGLNESTREIPRIYSEAKQAIMMLRNMTPTLNIKHFGADPMRR